jgi:hypothetical protein
MLKRPFKFIAAAFCSTLVSSVFAWDHPGQMTTAAVAFAEIEQARPDLIDKIGVLMMKHPDPAPFWVAAGEAKGKERTRRMFIEGARWPDDARWTIQDRPAWHSARWAILTDDAPPEAQAIVEARGGRPTGQALESLALNAAVLANPESKPDERALALSWLIHVLGDIHQPFHVSDLFSKQFPSGNLGGVVRLCRGPSGGFGCSAAPALGQQLDALNGVGARRRVRPGDHGETSARVLARADGL